MIYEYVTTRRRLSEETTAPATSPEAAYAIVRDMADLPREHLVIVLVNQKNRAIGRETLYVGTVTDSSVRIAEMFTLAIRQDATGILIAHNHPSGDPTPSADDVRTTAEAVAAGKLLGIRVVDHIVVGEGGKYYSMREHGQGFPMV